jgi:DNA repair protein RadC
MSVRDLPIVDRPRERLSSFGASSLSLQELLGVILGHGGAKGSILDITKHIVGKYKNLQTLDAASIQELTAIEGVGQAKAVQIKAAFELGKRLQVEYVFPESDSVFNSLDAFKLADKYLRHEKKEHLMLFSLDNRRRLITKPEVISVGTLDSSLLHPREIFVKAIKNYASSVILAHNHPSGVSQPSPQDLEVTKQIFDAGKIIGIQLVDHIVLGLNEYVSIHECFPQLFQGIDSN